MKYIVLTSIALVLSICALIAEGQEHAVCPKGTLPTTVSYEWKNPQGDATLAKVTGTLCGTYAQEQIVGPYLFEEDFRKILETKGFVVHDTPRPLKNVR